MPSRSGAYGVTIRMRTSDRRPSHEGVLDLVEHDLPAVVVEDVRGAVGSTLSGSLGRLGEKDQTPLELEFVLVDQAGPGRGAVVGNALGTAVGDDQGAGEPGLH